MLQSVGSIRVRTDEDVAEGSQALAELFDLGLVSLGLVALLVLGAALLLNVEAEVLEEHNGAIVSLGDNVLDLGADAVGGEGDGLAEQLLELRDDGLERVLGVDGTVGAAEVGHEDDRLGAIVEGVLDGRDGADDALGVGDVFVLVERDVEVDLKGLAREEKGSDHNRLENEATGCRTNLFKRQSQERVSSSDIVLSSPLIIPSSSWRGPELTRMRTRLPLTSTSVMESLLDSDMVGDVKQSTDWYT